MDRVFPNRVDRLYQFRPVLSIKQLHKGNRFIKRRLRKIRDIFHITILLDIMNGLLDKRALLRI